jgi:hypothetical protein
VRTRHLQFESETRDGRTVYFAYVYGKYFEHQTQSEVLEHLLVAALADERYGNSQAKQETDPKYQFLWETIFHGLEDLNSGFDAPLIPHFSADDFAIVIQRCAQHQVQINGIEVFDISSWPVSLLEVCGGRYARSLVKLYCHKHGVSFCASFDVGANIPGGKEGELPGGLVDLEEALGGKRGHDNGNGSIR